MHDSKSHLTSVRLEAFSALLEQAFPLVPVPLRVADSTASDEPLIAQSMLVGKRWNKLDAADLCEQWGDTCLCSCLPFLTGTAFRYYLPFFLKYCLEHPEHDVSDVEMIMRMLGGRQSKVETPNYIEDMIEPFTCDQIKAIGEFVKIAMRLFDGRIPHSDFDHLVERYVQSP